MIKQVIKHVKNSRKNIYMQPAALKMPKKTLPDMAWPGRQKFSG